MVNIGRIDIVDFFCTNDTVTQGTIRAEGICRPARPDDIHAEKLETATEGGAADPSGGENTGTPGGTPRAHEAGQSFRSESAGHLQPA